MHKKRLRSLKNGNGAYSGSPVKWRGFLLCKNILDLCKPYKKLWESALSKTFHRNVLEGKFAWVC